MQFFLNFAVFGMDVQNALDAPMVYTTHFPSSFYPRQSYPGRMVAEDRIDVDVVAELEKRGHQVDVIDGWSAGKAMGIHIDVESGIISGGATSRRRIAYAMGW